MTREELNKAEFLSNDNNEDMLQQSQVVGGETVDVMRPSNPHLVSNSSMASIDSGIVMHPRGTGSLKRNDRISSGYMEDVEGGNWGLGNFFSKGLGPFPVYPPVSSDSDSETSGFVTRMNGWMDGWMDEWMDGWMNEWIDGWMDGWMDVHNRNLAKLLTLL